MNVSDRLRVHAGSVLTTTDRVLVEAADEIDRLRATVESFAAVDEARRKEVDSLRAELAECRAAASDAAHMLEIARVWGGLDWSWTNLHHSIAKCAWEKLTDALAAKEKVK